MANIEKLQFPALEITGANYTAWITNMELHLDSEKILDTIKEGNKTASHEKAKAVIFLRKHLDENLTHDYARIKDPLDLWKALKERFDNQKKITLPHALDEWANLRFQDFEKVETYNSAILRIAAQLEYCGKPVTEAEMLEKTYQTFHKNHYVLQEQYRNRGYTRFSELAVALMIAEKNNELLIKNHNIRPTGTKAFPEVNATDVKNPERGNVSYRGRGRGRGYGRGRGHRFNRGNERSYNPKGRGSNTWNRSDRGKGNEAQENPTRKNENVCYRCGSKGHWSQVCRTPQHLCKLYQETIRGKAKEVNLNEHFEGTTSTYLESSDFMDDVDEATHQDN
ncbi:uncharacterized protein LOC130511798 [Raphanus sativus]|uniref:Uncharacterized protein LOC108851284 n=2 Tax=Raphanus sativus TaxID=3726 RepID=A0A9W3DI59_RAPSA|nr:uncharacterized protein LOC108851284 [Raphanus sativus]XP_056858175.1 uncharacterized protein LOC130507487 [Raphanus sativus]XP_056863504.1 uncharacterized protein LOC130510845 [Raphanus sativus]XP_056865454.1 uncharacterized protein LOC130511798 [Raphanus sativus]